MSDIVAGGLGALGDVVGALINTSSAQAINAKTLQQQLFLAGGGQYKSMVENAQAAGINPLVAFGQGGAGGSPALNVGDLGTGVAAAGKELSTSLKDLEQRQAVLEKTKAETANTHADTVQKSLEAKRQTYAIDYMDKHKGALPAGVSLPGPLESATEATASRITIPKLSNVVRGMMNPKNAEIPFVNMPSAGVSLGHSNIGNWWNDTWSKVFNPSKAQYPPGGGL